MSYTIKGVEPAHNAALDAIEKKSGPNNFLRVMARRPEAMEAFTRFYGALMAPSSLLDRRLKEMVYLAVSFVNECS
jgi:alkylhydroperoxidase family enzyme